MNDSTETRCDFCHSLAPVAAPTGMAARVRDALALAASLADVASDLKRNLVMVQGQSPRMDLSNLDKAIATLATLATAAIDDAEANLNRMAS